MTEFEVTRFGDGARRLLNPATGRVWPRRRPSRERRQFTAAYRSWLEWERSRLSRMHSLYHRRRR